MVYKLSLVNGKQEIAYRYGTDSNEEKWLDPFGGEFTEEEQDNMRRCAEGSKDYLTLHRGSKHEKQFVARLVVQFR
jgi:hypothetical protein